MAKRHAGKGTRTPIFTSARRRSRAVVNPRLLTETLEPRQLLAVGPQIVGINPNSGELLNDGDTRHIAPQQLTFRFDGNQVIDADTLSGIVITRTGRDGGFDVATAVTDLGTNGAVLARFTSVVEGPSGNGVTITIEPVDFGEAMDPVVTVTGKSIVVEVNTFEDDPTTALALVTAINRDVAARQLVSGAIVEGSNGAIIGASGNTVGPISLAGANQAEVSTDFGTSGDVSIRFRAVQQGAGANGTMIAFQRRNLGLQVPPQISLVAGTLNIVLNTTAGSQTTAGALIDAIANSAVASARVRADLLVGNRSIDIATPSAGINSLTMTGATDVLITPGFVGVDPNDPSQVIVRFAETLPDERYSIDILGTGDTPLTNVDGDAFRDGSDYRLVFTLDLGAQVLAVVPQPITRVNGQLTQARNQIVVYFNDDDLEVDSVTDPDFYQLIFTNHTDQFDGAFDTVTNTDDQLFLPTSVTYDPDSDMAVLTFSDDLNNLAGGEGTFRLRIGTDERFQVGADELRIPPAPVIQATDLPELIDDFGTGDAVQLRFRALADFGSAVRLALSAQDLGATGTPRVSVFQNTVSVVLNSNPANTSTAADLVDAIGRAANHLLDGLVLGGDADTVIPVPGGMSVTYDVPGLGSAFSSATDVGTLGVHTRIYQSSIDAQVYPLAFPGQLNEPGHRVIANQLHYEAGSVFNENAVIGDLNVGIETFAYNFREVYGSDPNGNPLFNLITEAQKDRAREVFEVYGEYLGVDFIETDDLGFTIVTGDMRALSPGIGTGPGGATSIAMSGMAIMDNAEQWYDNYGASDDPARISWYERAMHEIGTLLGLGSTDELPPFTVMNDEPDLVFDNDIEDVFPGDNDIVHGLFLHRTESKDIDLYRFEIVQTGELTAETIAERLTNSSLLDTSLNLYRELPDGTREIIARNDDYFSEDSLIRIALDPGIYYVGVSASGNSQYDPDSQDSGIGGASQGNYELRLNFRADANTAIVDETGTAIDGDADGAPGGVFNFWFRVGNTLFVDKQTGSPTGQGGNGSITTPYSIISQALAAAQPGDIVRVVGNGGADGVVSTVRDNLAYEVGFNSLGGTLADGTRLDVPRGVTMMVDAGAMFKMRRSYITIGSTAIEIDRSGSALQILGTPRNEVIFTSYNAESVGVDTDPLPQTPRSGDWGGLLFAHDLDRAEERFDYERQGIFLDTVNFANMQYGGGRVVVDSFERTIAPIHLIDARPTISYNSISRSADAAVSANPDSFEETNFHAPEYQTVPFTPDYVRVGPDIHGNTVLRNSINGLFIRIATPAGNDLERMTVSGRWDDTDIVHVIAENLEIQGTPGGPTGTAANRTARLDASLVIDPAITVKLDGAGIETQLGAQLIAEGVEGREIIFTSVLDDSYGAGGTFDTSNNGANSGAVPGDWTGLYFGPVSRGSLDYSLLSFGGGITKVGGSFAGFNVLEIQQAEVRVTNNTFENNASGTGGQARRNRDGRGRNAPGAIYVLGAQPIILNNVIRGTLASGSGIGPAININANALNSDLVFDYGRSTGQINLERSFRDNQGPLIRTNKLENNEINGMVVRGATLTTESVWDDTDIVHVLLETIYIPDFHTFGGLRLESSPDESLVVKLSGATAGFTATGRPLDIVDRIGGSLYIVGQPGRPVILTSLNDGSVGAGFTSDGTPQNNTSNSPVPGRTLPAGSFSLDLNFGPDISTNPTITDSIQRAAAFWESIIQDPIQVRLDVEFNVLTGGVDGFALPVIHRASYDAVRTAMINDAGNHEGIVSDLPTFAQLQTVVTGNRTVLPSIDLSRANALALGFNPATLPVAFSAYNPTQQIDGAIQINIANNVAGGDVFDTAVEQIGHALGFLSTINDPANNVALMPLDLFRLAPGEGQADFRNAPRVLNPALDTVFYDGGIFNPGTLAVPNIGLGDIPLAGFDVVGDSNDPAHWRSPGALGGVDLGIMSAAGGSMSDADRRAFDLLGWDIVSNGTPGEWRSVRLDQYSNDRNVEVVTERESALITNRDANGTTSTAEFLGQLAPNEKSGDDNLRLGFQVHGFLSHNNDVDLYSFEARTGTEIWIDLDRTAATLDAVVELVDASGKVLARSNDSYGEALAARLSDAGPAELLGGIGNVLDKADNGYGDYYGTNAKDPGMRVVLPGRGNTANTYHVRVTSQNSTSGTYQLQLRLRQNDEVPGSTIRYADIRFATNAIEVLGQPMHSPLLGETVESTAPNNFIGNAQIIGNVLTQDYGTLSIAGVLDSATDVDWYQFDLLYDSVENPSTPGALQWASVVFDLDYSDGVARADTSLYVFNNLGQLVLTSRDGIINDDLAAPGQGDDSDDLSRGSAGAADPFIGPVSLPVGTYYVAVSTSNQRPAILNQFDLRQANPIVPTLRLEPVDSVTRVAEDHVSTVTAMETPVLFGRDFSLFVPAGWDVVEGETVAIDLNDGSRFTFEFDSNEQVRNGNIPVVYRTDSTQILVRNAFRNAALDVLPNDVIMLPGANGRIQFIGPVGNLGVSARSEMFVSRPAQVPYFLNDLNLWVGQNGGGSGQASTIVMVDGFTGLQETILGGFGGQFSNDRHGDIAINPVGMTVGETSFPGEQLYTLSHGSGSVQRTDDNTGNLLHLNYQTASATFLTDDGVETFELDPESEDPATIDSDEGIIYNAMTFGGSYWSSPNQMGFFAVGGRSRTLDPTDTPTLGNDYGTNMLFEFDVTTGQATSLPAQDRVDDPNIPELRFEGGGTQIRERGYIDTLFNVGAGTNAMRVVEATRLDGNGNTVLTIPDQLNFQVALTGPAVTFRMDAGPQVLLDFDGADFVRDGDFFTLNGVKFEFDTGPVLNVISGGNGFTDGSTFSITDRTGTVRTFEIDVANNGVAGGSVPVSFAGGAAGQVIATQIASAINNASFGVVATAVAGRVTLVGDRDITLSQGFAGAVLEGTYGPDDAGAVVIPVEETFGRVEILDEVVDAVNGDGRFVAAYEFERLNFPNATTGDFTNAPIFTSLNTNGESVNTSIDFSADDTAADVAQKIANAINTRFGAGTATAAGDLVTLTRGTFQSAEAPFILGGEAPGGLITGMAFMDGDLFVVSDAGGLWLIEDYQDDDGEITQTLITTVVDDDGAPIEFAGLTAGPAGVENDRYASMFFAIDISGDLYALNTSGVLQPVFYDAQTSVSTGLGNATGLAFSLRTENPWYFTSPNDPVPERESDEGHGSVAPVTQTRGGVDDPNTTNINESASAGGSTLHFGGGQNGNYDAPGGTHGTVISNTFSLKNYEATDQPALYFNYFIDTDNVNGVDQFSMMDSFRAYVSSETSDLSRGKWQLVGTNNTTVRNGIGGEGSAPNDELDDQAADGMAINATLLHRGAGWRQARVDLSAFAGMSDLRLRFDFATAGEIGLGSFAFGGAASFGSEGEELTMVDGYLIQDGQQVVIGQEVFEFDSGFSLVAPTGNLLSDGETFTLRDGDDNILTFELDSDGQTSVGRTAIPFTPLSTGAALASTIASAVTASGMNVVPSVFGHRVNLPGVASINQAGIGGNPSALLVSGAPGVLENGAIPISVNLGMTPAEVKLAFMTAYADEYTGGDLDVIKNYGNTVRIVGRSVLDPGPFGLENGLYGEHINGNPTGVLVEVQESNPGEFRSNARRAVNNNFEGIYLDDFVIGLAGRGETVTNIANNAVFDTTFDTDPAFAPNDIVRGPYQLEIRRASEYGTLNPFMPPPQAIVRTFEVNERLSDGVTLEVPAGDNIAAGQSFDVGNRTNSVTVQYVDQTLRENNETIDEAQELPLFPGIAGRFVGIGMIGDNFAPGDQASVTPTLDVDMYAVRLAAGDVLTVDTDSNVPTTTESIRTLLDTIVRIFDAQGNQLAISDDAAAPGEVRGLDSFVRFTAPTEGDYFIGVSRFANNGYDPLVANSGAPSLVPGINLAGRYVLDVRLNDGTTAVTPGLIQVGYSQYDSANDIARRMTDALNASASLRAIGITAGVRGNTGTVDLFGKDIAVLDIKRLPIAEPNNLIAEAVDAGVIPGTPNTIRVAGTIGDAVVGGSVAGDVDVIRLSLVPGDTVFVRSFLNEISSTLIGSLSVVDAAGNSLAVGDAPLDTTDINEADPELFFRVFEAGDYFLSVQGAFGTTGRYELEILVNEGAIAANQATLFGDGNTFRPQGQILIQSNVIRDSLDFGIVVDAGTRDAAGNPHMGPVRVLREVNEDRFVPGVTVTNNIVARGGEGGIRFAGTINQFDNPVGAIPFGRILNNTVFGQGGRLVGAQFGSDVGILVENNASPTLLNNIVANFSVGVQIDATSNTTVLGGLLVKWNATNGITPNGLGDFPILLLDSQPLFVDPLSGNFYLDLNSPAIDSSVNSLEDRAEMTTIRNPLGIPVSPILAPGRDVRGQLRLDDPDVDSPAGIGEDVFKDRGALERADFDAINAVLTIPPDNDADGIDLNPAFTIVQTFENLSEFAIRLSEGVDESEPSQGVGADDLSVTTDNVTLTRNGVTLVDGIDYSFEYDATNDVIHLRSLAGIWPTDQAYEIVINNEDPTGIRDLANNYLRPNQTTGETRFNIILGGSTDFGDAPASYPTLLADDGARHEFRVNYFLGSGVDSESDGNPSSAATGDADDGVLFEDEVRRGFGTQVGVLASASGQLDAWIDFNQDGDWNDAGEKVFDNLTLDTGVNVLDLTIPMSASVGQTFARFRFSSTGGLAPTGAAVDGEVEDYQIEILDRGFDFGDAPDFTTGTNRTYPTLLVSDGARHERLPGMYLGSEVDPEEDGQDSADASADGSDEDGVVLPSSFQLFTTSTIEVFASTAGFLDAWIDFDQIDGWNDLEERIFDRQPLVAGRNVLEVTVPASAIPGDTFARFRYSSVGGLATTGAAADGEVEDYRVSITQPSTDFGDAPASYGTTLAANGARHLLTNGLILGATVDAESDGQVSSGATGDGSDEDGVQFNQELLIGKLVTGDVTVSQDGLLDAWVDWNRDGVFGADERIATSTPMIAGLNALDVQIPATVEPGIVFARFRVSSAGGLEPTGVAINGEVEDYRLNIIRGSWHNSVIATDVNNDSQTSPLDAIIVINEMDSRSISDPITGRLPNVADPPPYYDVNDDGFVSPLDAVIVINGLPASQIAAAAAPAAALSAAAATGVIDAGVQLPPLEVPTRTGRAAFTATGATSRQTVASSMSQTSAAGSDVQAQQQRLARRRAAANYVDLAMRSAELRTSREAALESLASDLSVTSVGEEDVFAAWK